MRTGRGLGGANRHTITKKYQLVIFISNIIWLKPAKPDETVLDTRCN